MALAKGTPIRCMGGVHHEAGGVVISNPAGRSPVWSRAMPCPFCREPLARLDNAHEVTFARVSVSCKGERPCDGLANVLPPELEAFRCMTCDLWMFGGAQT